MSYTISNYCPSSLIDRFESIPKKTTKLILGETHLADRTIFPPLPSHIKEVHIEKNIYGGKKQIPLIREDMTNKEVASLLRILFPNYKGVEFFTYRSIIYPHTTQTLTALLDDVDLLFN